jgi:hypothetical protein
MLDKDKPVQGYVIYAEFTLGDETRQIFFTPDGYTSLGHLVPMQAHYRTVGKHTPRKQWKNTNLSTRDLVPALSAAAAGDPDPFGPLNEEWAENRVLTVIRGYLSQIISREWKMVGAPLVVEASKQDMDDIHGYKTPTKIIYRLNQTRLAAGYPAELF